MAKDLDDAFDSWILAVYGRLENPTQLRELRRSFYAGCHFVACNTLGGKSFLPQTVAFCKRVTEDKD